MKWASLTAMMLIACASARLCPPAAVAPNAPPALAAGAMTIATRYCAVDYPAGLRRDGLLIARLIDDATRALIDELGGDPVRKIFERTTCRVHVLGTRTELAQEGRATTHSSTVKEATSADLYFFAPSLHDPKAKTAAGLPMDVDYFAKTVVHELSSIVLVGMTATKATGWSFYSAPGWFTQGLEEYLACIRSKPSGRTVVLPAYVKAIRANPSRIRFFPELAVEDVYADGAVLLAFLHDTMGKARVHAILASKEATFNAAFDKELGIDRAQLPTKFEAWLTTK